MLCRAKATHILESLMRCVGGSGLATQAQNCQGLRSCAKWCSLIRLPTDWVTGVNFCPIFLYLESFSLINNVVANVIFRYQTLNQSYGWESEIMCHKHIGKWVLREEPSQLPIWTHVLAWSKEHESPDGVMDNSMTAPCADITSTLHLCLLQLKRSFKHHSWAPKWRNS